VSRIYFNSPSGDAELLGAEGAHLRGFVYDLAVGMLNLDGTSPGTDHLYVLVPPEHYLKHGAYQNPNTRNWTRDFGTAFRTDSGGAGALMRYQGRELHPLTLALNTALVMGNDVVRLAARIAGQNEIHGWVDGPNRAWLADIVQEGLDLRIFRKTLRYQPRPGAPLKQAPLGWEDVITLLRARDDEPVVMSYSVTESFPNRKMLGRTEEDDDWFDELPASEQWALCMIELRNSDTGLREMRPDCWTGHRFGDGLSVLDLTAQDWEDRVRAAFGMKPLFDFEMLRGMLQETAD
jgi:hypothetical protein